MKKILPVLLFQMSIPALHAQWNADTAVRNAICTAPNAQISPQLCTDGAKGAIITWTDIRTNPPVIYSQKIDSNGVTKWTSNGIVATVGSSSILPAYPVSDGSGGAIIVYELSIIGGETHIHAQRLDANGNAMWGNAGIRIDTIGESRLNNDVGQVIIDDGNGGAFFTWRHYFFGVDEIRIQHIDHNGNILLGPQGLAVSNNTMGHYSAKIIYTGNNTCVVAYEEQGKLIMQRINAAGNKMWAASGVLVTNTMTSITTNNFYILNTSAKNIAVVWEDVRIPSNLDIYAQKVDTNGLLKWAATGVVVDTSAFITIVPEIAVDNSDGFYTVFGYSKIFVQHLNASGQLLWGVGGKQVSTSPVQYIKHICSDGNNGMLVSWEEPNLTQRIYAQRYDSAGTALWRPNGLPVAKTGNSGANANHRTLGLNSGRAITVWEDYRNGNQDIFAARFGNNAILTLGLTALNTCFGDSTQFNDITTSTASTINFWRWDFGDASPVATIKNPKHKYAATGNYNVTLTLMDDEFNYRVFAQPVTINSKPTLNLGNDTTICAGNTIILNAGNAGLSYLWSTGAVTQSINVNTAGSYWAQVSNGTCSTKDTIVLAISASVAVNLGNDTAICAGNAILLNAANNGGTYLWSTGATTQTITAATAGVYWVQVTSSGGCIGKDTIVLTTKPLPTAGFSFTPNGLSVNFNNTSSNATIYNWLFGDGFNSSATSPVHTYAVAGTYPVKLLAGNTCKTDSIIQNIIVTGATTIPDSCGNQLSTVLFPNPVHDLLSIKFLTPLTVNVTITIINTLGQRMRTYEFAGIKCKDVKQIDMRGFASGVYFFKIKGNGINSGKQVVKQ